MRVDCIGGGPAGLYLAILLRKAGHHVRVFERNRLDDTFGFGVVFSDQTLGNIETADPETYAAISGAFAHWDDIDIHFDGHRERSTGHGFAGLSRQTLLEILANRATVLGAEVHFQHEVRDLEAHLGADLVVGCDGLNSAVRARWEDRFEPSIDLRPNRFVWLGTSFPYEAFTFYFKADAAGLWRIHAYRYAEDQSTFIAECTAETFARSGLAAEDEAATIAYLEALFADELGGHRLLANRSIWRQFPTVSCRRWSFENVVLLGDAVHTAHFSIGSGTKLAMEDAIALAAALEAHPDVRSALEAYEADRRSNVASTQRAAQVSLEWFETTERYLGLEPLQFAFSLLTRSLRVSHENLRLRDPALVSRVDRWFSGGADVPPMFTPYSIGALALENRIVVSPMCQYTAEDGAVDDWHLVHLGSRAIGGAGLVITEMTDVSAEGRITPGCAGLYADAHVAGWRRIVDFVHRFSAAKIGIQLAHAGRKGSTRVPWAGEDLPLEQGNWPLLAPSPIPYRAGINAVPKAMDRADMDRVRDDFVAATRRAAEAGFDLLEVHCAHGYLLGTFLSPLTNRREDEYGGDAARRAAYPLEVLRAVREAWPKARPISVRISATDWVPGGFGPEDAVRLAVWLREAGADIIDVSAGQTVPEQRPRYGRLFQTPFAEHIRLETGIPTMTVGNISTHEDVNSVLAGGRADLCVIARAHLYDPYWTRHAAEALGYPLPWPPQYRVLDRYTPRPV